MSTVCLPYGSTSEKLRPSHQRQPWMVVLEAGGRKQALRSRTRSSRPGISCRRHVKVALPGIFTSGAA